MATNVEALSHEQISHMVAPVNSERVMVASDRIRTAAARIAEAANRVLAKPGQIVWQGQAADTFRTWNEQVVKAGQDTAFYADMVGMHLGVLGSELADAMARMPSVPQKDIDKLAMLRKADPTALAQVDPDTGKTGEVLKTELTASVEEAHQAALSQMRNIVMVYQSGIANIGGVPVPVYPPPGNPFSVQPSPEDVGAATGVAAAAAAGLLAAQSGTGTSAPPNANNRVQGATPQSQTAWPGTPGGAVPQVVTTDRQVGFTPGTRPVGTPGSGPLSDTTLAGGLQGQPNVTAPGSSPSGGVGPTDPQGTRPGWGASPVAGRPVVGGSERQPGEPGRGGATGLRGEEVSGNTSRFAKPAAGPEAPAIPMRGGMPMGGAPGGMPTGGGGGRGGGARPVGMPGGIVGGRPSSSEGGAGRAAFSPGGSGLRADRAEAAGRAGGTRAESGSAGRSGRVGPMGAGHGPTDSEPGRRRARRPDYLHADEDDWDGRGSGPVPPVIG